MENLTQAQAEKMITTLHADYVVRVNAENEKRDALDREKDELYRQVYLICAEQRTIDARKRELKAKFIEQKRDIIARMADNKPVEE